MRTHRSTTKPRRRRFGPPSHLRACKRPSSSSSGPQVKFFSIRIPQAQHTRVTALRSLTILLHKGAIKMGKHEDADLILKLYDLRRETVMREARNWWFTFNPTSLQDVMTTMMGDQSGYMRMVLSYWDMACAMVVSGAIDEDLFNTTNGEHMIVYMKIEPVLQELRTMFDNQDFAKSLETVVKRMPNIDARMASMRERFKQIAAMRAQQAQAAQA